MDTHACSSCYLNLQSQYFGANKDPELSPEQVQSLRDRLRGLRYLFVDENSMIGTSMLYRIHQRLAIAFPSVEDSPFGGISIIFMGDYAQLPPVGDTQCTPSHQAVQD